MYKHNARNRIFFCIDSRRIGLNLHTGVKAENRGRPGVGENEK